MVELLLSRPKSLGGQAFSAGAWVLAMRGTGGALSLARSIFLARLLAPADFGVFGIATLSVAVLQTFSQTGFRHALIQKKGEIESYLDSTWTVGIIRGIALSLLLLGGAPFVALFFAEPRAVSLIRIVAVSVLVEGFHNPGVVYFRKELEFDKQFLYEFAGIGADLVAAVCFGVALQSALALVFGLLARNVVQLVMSFALHPYRPRFLLDRRKCMDLIGFGRWVLGYSATVFLATQGDDIFLAKFLGVGALGLYQMAYRVSSIIKHECAAAISLVSYPTFSKLQDDRGRLKDVFLKAWEFSFFIGLPAVTGIVVLASDGIRVFLGDKWLPMATTMQILAVAGLAWTVLRVVGPLFEALGHPDIVFWVNLTRLTAMTIFIYPLTARLGVEGTAVAVLLANGIAAALAWSRMLDVLDMPQATPLQAILPSVAGSLGLGALVLAGKRVFHIVGAFELLALVLTGVAGYLTSLFFVWRRLGKGPLRHMDLLIAAVRS